MKLLILAVISLFSFVKIGNAQYERQYVSLGVGPSMIYADNSGFYNGFKFKIQPVATFTYNYQMSFNFDLRTTLGTQMLNSGGFDPVESYRVFQWTQKDQAFDFTGLGYFGDLMPTYIFNPNIPGRRVDLFTFYGGIGIGVIQVSRNQKKLRDAVYVDRIVFVSGRIEEEKAIDTAL
jgi:hypothetical protein